MNRFLLAAAIVCAAVIAVVIALPWLISSETVRDSLHERAREITGRDMVFAGDPKVAFSPFLGIEISDVSFKGGREGAETLLSMPTLRGKLSFTGALRGRVHITEFQFVRPQFNLSIRADGTTNWSFGEGDVWQVLQQARQVREETETGSEPDITKISDARIGTFSVIDGLINYTDERTSRTETISNFNGTLVWPSTRAAWQLNGNGIWRGDQVSLTHTAARPIMLLAGGSSKVTANIVSEPMSLTFEGEANRFSNLFLTGNISARSPSLRRTINFFGGEAGTGSSFSDFQASGKFAGTFRDLQLSQASLQLDGNRFTGSLRLGGTGELADRLSGTLASESINLAPYTRSLTTPEGIRSLFRILNGTEMDVRLSANSVALGELTIQDFAGGLIAKPGDFMLDVGNAAIGDGLLVGQLTAALSEDTAEIGARMDASSVNPSAFSFLNQISAVSPSGMANVSVDMTSSASEEGDFASNVSGRFSINMENGTLRGLDFSQLRPSLEGNADTTDNIEIGDSLARTPVREFRLQGDVNHGVAWIGDSSFLMDDYRSRISGKADLRSGNLAVWGLMQKQDEGGDWRSHSQYFLGGTLAEPLYVPQLTSKSPLPINESGDVPDIGRNETQDSGAKNTTN